MTATENNTQYWVCASTYHGFDESLQNNGDTVRITTVPIYTDEEQQTICCDWGCSQDGPFDNMEEAREAMVALYGPCRQFDYEDSEYRYFVKEAWAVHQYYILTKGQAEETLNYYPLPETTDDEIKEEAASFLFWLHDKGDHYDQEDIEGILFERRERAKEEVEEEEEE